MNLKKIGQKIMAVFVIVTLLHWDFTLCGVGISKVIAENLNTPEIEVNVENVQYVQYCNEEYAGVAIQSKISLKAEQQQEEYLPEISSQISVNLPSINECYPERVKVINAYSTLETGEIRNIDMNQNYDQDSGLLNIAYELSENDQKTEKDEIEIIYIYSANAYTGNEEEIELNYQIGSRISYQAEESVISSNIKKTIVLKQKENIGDLASLSLTNIENPIYKGFMYANVENGTDYETEFTTTSTLTILNSESVTPLNLAINEANFVLNDEEKTEIVSNDLVQYKTSKITKADFDNMFGKDGYMEIYNADKIVATVKYLDIDDTETLSVIYDDGEVDMLEDSENITINYEKGLSNIIIKTSKPVTEGVLKIDNTCAIINSNNYGENVENLDCIKIYEVANDYTKSTLIKLQEPETKISVEVSNTNFSTLNVNSTNITIKLDDTNASTKLFENPTIEVTLPDGIKYGNITNPNILYGNGLDIKNIMSDGNVMKIELEGKQNEYDLTNIAGGTLINIDISNLYFKKDVPTHEDEISVKCVNREEEKNNNIKVNIKSGEGIYIYASATGFDDDGTIKEEEQNKTTKIEIGSYEETRNLKNEFAFVNNNEKEIENLSIVSLFNFSLNSEEKSTFIMNLQKEIEINKENANIQYIDENKNLTSEFSETTIGYKVTFADNIKPLEGFTISAFTTIPEKVGDDALNYSITQFVYYYEGNQVVTNYSLKLASNESLKVREESENEIVTNPTTSDENINVNQDGELTVELVEIKTGDKYITETTDLKEAQTVSYKYVIKNNTQNDYENLKVRTTVTNANYYEIVDSGIVFNANGETAHYWAEVSKENGIEDNIISSLKAGEQIEYEYQIVPLNEGEVENIIEVYDDNVELSERQLVNKVDDAKLYLNIEPAQNIEKTLGDEEDYGFKLNILNLSEKKLKNLEVYIYLPEELSCKYVENADEKVDVKYESSEHIIKCTFKALNVDSGYELLFLNNVEDFDINLDSKNISIVADCTIDEEYYISNEYEDVLQQNKSRIKLDLTDNLTKEELTDGDVVDYVLDVTNKGAIVQENSYLYGNFDDGLKIKNAYIVWDNGQIEILDVSNNQIKRDITLVNNTHFKLYFSVAFIKKEVTDYKNEVLSGNVGIVDEYTNTFGKEINLSVELFTFDKIAEEIENAEINKISGTAWNDENKDGVLNNNESSVSNLQVSLVEKETGEFVKNEKGEDYTVTTDENGNYSFDNIDNGSYIAVFKYDTDLYEVTTYNKENNGTETNSDAISTKAQVYGEEEEIAITDNIEIDSNKEQVNIGLTEKINKEKIKENKVEEKLNRNNTGYVISILIGLVIITGGIYIIKKKILDV